MKKRALSTIFLVLMCVVVASPAFTALVTQPKLSFQQTTMQKVVMSTSTISIDGNVLRWIGAVPIQGANVTIIGGKIIGGITFAFQKSTPTNANGYYSFSDVPIGLFLVIARKPGEYLPGFRFVRLTPSQPVKHNQDIHMIYIGGNSSESMSEYIMTLSTDEQVLLQQYMNTLPVSEQALMQQSMNAILTNEQILIQK
jgi:hypothetical protein